MNNHVGIVFQSKDVAETGGNSCVVMAEDVLGVTYAFISSDGVSVKTRAQEGFLSLWGASEKDLESAAKHYMGIIETHPVNDPRAVEFFKNVLAGVPAADAMAPVAAVAVAAVVEAPVVIAAAAETPVPVVAVAPVAVAPVEALAPVVDPVPVFETVATPAPVAEVASAPAVIAPVQTPVQVPVVAEKAPEVVVVQPVAVQPQKENVRMTMPQSETIQPADGEEDQAYSVRVTGSSVTVDMGKNRETRMGPDTYANHPQTIVNSNPEPTFYAGFDDKGVLVRVVSINDVDRKVVGAMIGGWVAECLSVSKVTLKDLAKHVGAARKVFEVKKGEPAQEPAPAPTGDAE